ncbi:MAG: hypothetical protein KDH15_15715 [Rhodocyclaceae bacterium]|nr:hypothetical protein [Rhodocyclaceae bacterium]
MSINELRDLTDDKLRDAAGRITPESRERALGLAVARYSTDRPRELVADVVSAGGQELPLPAGWVAGVSGLRAVELLPEQVPPALLPISRCLVYRRPAGEAIILDRVLTAGDAVRLTFTAPHVLDDTTDTIPEADRGAVACYAAAELADQLAAASADDVAPTIAADSADQGHAAREWAATARRLRARYFAALGIATHQGGAERTRTKPAGVVVDVDLSDSRDRGWLGRRR